MEALAAAGGNLQAPLEIILTVQYCLFYKTFDDTFSKFLAKKIFIH